MSSEVLENPKGRQADSKFAHDHKCLRCGECFVCNRSRCIDIELCIECQFISSREEAVQLEKLVERLREVNTKAEAEIGRLEGEIKSLIECIPD